jgi:prepilin-type N-terminal cleavage/methylation domain-containing protein
MYVTGSRPGFTLIELLVVLGILVILSTIGVAAFISSGKVNRLVATEQLIGSQVRQARYTARATGQAVLLYISKDAGTISGVSRISMWQGSCEAPYVRLPATYPTTPPTADEQAPFDVQNQLDRSKFLMPVGRTGTGIGRQHGVAQPTDTAIVTLFNPISPTGETRSRQLTRASASSAASEGFALSCAVRPVRLTGPGAPQPLLIIGNSDGDITQSYAGLMLIPADLPMYNSSETPPTVAASHPNITGNVNVDRHCWEIVGWVMGDQGTTPVVVASIEDSVSASGNPETNFLRDGDSGGRWEEISLVYTGSTLELYRDGVAIAKKTNAPTRIAGNGNIHQLIIGSASNVNQLLPRLVGTASSTVFINKDTVIDDIALFRLATDQPGRLAPGVTINRNVRLLIQPDGQMQDLPLAGSAPPPGDISLKFQGVFAEQDDIAEITITPGTGLIKSSRVTLSKSAP